MSSSIPSLLHCRSSCRCHAVDPDPYPPSHICEPVQCLPTHTGELALHPPHTVKHVLYPPSHGMSSSMPSLLHCQPAVDLMLLIQIRTPPLTFVSQFSALTLVSQLCTRLLTLSNTFCTIPLTMASQFCTLPLTLASQSCTLCLTVWLDLCPHCQTSSIPIALLSQIFTPLSHC